MKIKIEEKFQPPEPLVLKDGHKVWADTDSDNRIINLVLEHKRGHKLVQVVKGRLCEALKQLLT